MLKFEISSFKSIRYLSLDIAPVTLLIGPPASGKSNILDSIALLGYFERILRINEEYGDYGLNLESPSTITRFERHEQLFRYGNLAEKISMSLLRGDMQERINIYYEGGRLIMRVNDVDIPWDLQSTTTDSMMAVKNALNTAVKNGMLLGSRLYGYDRYGLGSFGTFSFSSWLRGIGAKDFPKNVLSELGWNAIYIIRRVPDIVHELNDVIKERFEEKVEIKVLRTGITIIFDYDFDVEALGVSDSIFRALYNLVAIRSAANYVKLYGLEGQFLLLLEEPEAHIFPFFMDVLAEHISDAAKHFYIVVSTHNPILVSLLWDKISDLKTYYILRGKDGSTKAFDVNIEKLAKDFITSEELLIMSPAKILSRYVKVAEEASANG